MLRKHERFNYDYGCRTAPEQWRFYFNGIIINLDSETRNNLACMCLMGLEKEAEDELKRFLRKEEKKPDCKYITFAFFGKSSKNYYFTQDLLAHSDNMNERLRVYKEWKRYILETKKGRLQPFTVKTGYITPYGNESVKTEDTSVEIDIHKCITVRVVESEKNIMFRK